MSHDLYLYKSRIQNTINHDEIRASCHVHSLLPRKTTCTAARYTKIPPQKDLETAMDNHYIQPTRTLQTHASPPTNAFNLLPNPSFFSIPFPAASTLTPTAPSIIPTNSSHQLAQTL